MTEQAFGGPRRDHRVDEDDEIDSNTPLWLERPKLPGFESGMRAIAIKEPPSLDSSTLSPRALDTLLPPSSEASKRVILVVGLDPVPTLSGMLRAAGFVLTIAKTIESARRFANEHIPAAILLAPSPQPEPYRLLHWIRNQRRLGFTQVFVLLADDEFFSARDAIVAGADEVLLAHDSSTHLEAAVDRIAARVARSQALSELSVLDPLTELHNRRFMNDRLPAEIARAARSVSTLSLAILDIDHFKSINDNLGHAVGDRALVAFAWVLRSNLRAYDIVCRFGGDEFVVLFPDCARERAEEALSQLNMHASGLISDLPPVTFSAGIAEFPHDGTSWTDLFDTADARLREGKRRGPSLIVARDI